MRHAVKLIVSTLALLCVSSLLTVPRASATPFGVTIRSQEFNLCSAVCGNRVAATNLAIFMVNDGFAGENKAHSLALNEVCLADAFEGFERDWICVARFLESD